MLIYVIFNAEVDFDTVFLINSILFFYKTHWRSSSYHKFADYFSRSLWYWRCICIAGPPSIVSHRTQFGIEGDNVRVECTAYSIPAPERVVWTFNGREVDSNGQDYSILEDPLPEGIKSTLIIRESQERHFGMYNCSVTNPYGSDVVEINLMPQSKFFSERMPLGK